MKTLLIIEDDKSQLQILQDKFAAEYRVLTAGTVADGWTLVQKELPDLVILDIMLPGGMNGFDLLEQLKKDSRFRAIPVLVVTNLDTEEEVTRKIGVADYLIKANTSIDEIATKVHTLLGQPQTPSNS